MNWITENIAIGNYLDATDTPTQQAEGIASLLCLDGKLKPSDAQRLGLTEIVSVPLIDGDGNSSDAFEQAVRAVERLSTRRPKLLVQCHAGRLILISIHHEHCRRPTKGY